MQEHNKKAASAMSGKEQITKPIKTEKPWGYELLFAYTPKYAGKVIFIRQGQRLSLQRHVAKDETMFLCKGKAVLTVEETSVDFKRLSAIRIPPGTLHRLEAIRDTVIIEVSTSELDDVVRVKDDYGRAGS